MSALQLAMLDAEAPAPVVLRDYQQACIDAINAAAARGVRRQLVVLPTGAGKTVVFATLIDYLLTWEGGRALILAHRDELVQQAVEKFRHVAGDRYTVGVVKAERNECDRQVLVGSVQTLANRYRLSQLPAADLTAVVIDECHHALSATYRRIVDALQAGRPGGPLLLGFTATPDRGDGKRIGDAVFDELVYSKSILDLIEAGYLCDVEARSVYLKDANLGAVHSRGGDLDAGELARVLLHANAPARILEAYRRLADGRKAIAFTPGVKLAHELARTFQGADIAAEAIDGSTHPAIRRAALARFAVGETRILCNDSVLTEGFDEPSVECIIMARPTKSRPLYTQIVGRGLRVAPGKRNCLVLDLCGNAGRHDLASVPDVFGLSGKRDVESIQEAVKRERVAKEASERLRVRDLERANLVSKTVSLFRRGAGAGMHWLPVQMGERTVMVLDLGTGLLKVGEARPDDWAVVLHLRGQRPRMLGRELAQHKAQQIAEAYARERGKPWAFRPGLAWRSGACSRKTRVYARAHGIALPDHCTAGEASDAILRHQAIHGFGDATRAPGNGARASEGRCT